MRMKGRTIFILGFLGLVLASPRPIDNGVQHALLELDPKEALEKDMRLVHLTPTDTRWMTEGQLNELKTVSETKHGVRSVN
jgi:hypothetical protein